jgi:hypothetical protein
MIERILVCAFPRVRLLSPCSVITGSPRLVAQKVASTILSRREFERLRYFGECCFLGVAYRRATYLTGATASRVDASEATEREIDVAVRDLVARAFDRATEVLRAGRADLDEGSRLPLAQETVMQKSSLQ